MADPPLWHDAAALAARAHRHHLRHDGETPYVAHPARVALVVAVVFGCTDETVLAAALVHDVIEDADLDYDDVSERLGPEVADLCAALSKDMRVVEPERERLYDEQLAKAPWQARLIKLADVYDNLRDARSAEDRRRILPRAERALALARDDRELAEACRRVRELVEAAGGTRRE